MDPAITNAVIQGGAFGLLALVTRKSKHFDVRFRDESGQESWVRVKALSERHALRIVHRSEAARPAQVEP